MEKKEQEKKVLSDVELGKKLREGREKSYHAPRKSKEEREKELSEKYHNMVANNVLTDVKECLKGKLPPRAKLNTLLEVLEEHGYLNSEIEAEETQEE